MNLLAGTLYDPSTVGGVSKATSALLAMTAVDTSNLRLAITVPAHGKVLFRMSCAVVGATTCPVVLLGAMNGATVLGRQQPRSTPVTAPAATQVFTLYAEFLATGLTPGAMNVDAAYAVQVVVASTNIKYGGANTNAGVNAWGGFQFEAWDPQPLKLALDGGVNVTQLLGTAWLTPGTAGTPDVNVKLWNGLTTVALPLVPTTAGRTLDVSATGEAGVDWANVGGATTAVDLANTTIKTTQKVDVDTIKTNPVVNGGTITFPTGATLASTTNITAGTVTTATNVTTVNGLAAGVITAASLAADCITDAKVAADVTIASVTGSVGSVTGNVGGNVAGSVGSVTGNVGGNVAGSVASVTARVTANTDQLAGQTVTAAAGVTFPTSVASPTNITAGTITTVTTLTNLPTAPTDWLTAAAVKADAVTKIQTGLATPTNITAASGVALTAAYDAAKTAAQPSDCITAAGVRTAVGLGSANLDTQLSVIAGYIDTEVAAILGAVDTEVAAIKAKTDNLPASPAAAGDCITVADILAGIVEGAITVQDVQKVLLAFAAGKTVVSGDTVTFRDQADTQDRITATVTAGERTSTSTSLA